MIRTTLALVALLSTGLAVAQQAPTSTAQPPQLDFEAQNALRQAVGTATRSITNVMRDAHRNPEATLGFFAVEPDHTVVEVWPGQGWYTEILAPLLAENGRLIAAHFDPQSDIEYFRKSREEFEHKMAHGRGNFSGVELTVLNYDPDTPIAEPGSADRVLTFRNVHNWLSAGMDETRIVFAKFHDALKPGGMLGVVEHRARPNASLEDMVRTGYVSEDLVIQLAEEAGLKLLSRSPVNQNPRDSADHPEGVWSLPPTLRNVGQNRAQFLAIGESDRMTLLFIREE
jgi:predicted methyltransferase